MENIPSNGGKEIEKFDPSEVETDVPWLNALTEKPENTDTGNAIRFSRLHETSARYCYKWDAWLIWDGCRWMKDDGDLVMRKAFDTIKQMLIDASEIDDTDERRAFVKHILRTESKSRLEAMVDLARSKMKVSEDDLDVNPLVLEVLNGTLDLRTGALHEKSPLRYNTKCAPVVYDENATCPMFEQFLEEIMMGRRELIRFLQGAIGYSMTGEVKERVFFICYGAGANGKSTLLNVIYKMLGDYSAAANISTFMTKPQGGEPATPEVASLKGARYVTALEGSEGQRLNEALVKRLTGGINEPMRARYLFSNPFTFMPQFKLWIGTNHKPPIKETGDAIWDRLKLIPFDLRIPEGERDRDLPNKLSVELPGILNWALKGCFEWQRDGIGTPEAVTQATNTYRDEQDLLKAFLDDKCECNTSNAEIQSTALYNAYLAWCAEGGERPVSQKAMAIRLEEKGFTKRRKGHGNYWQNIKIQA